MERGGLVVQESTGLCYLPEGAADWSGMTRQEVEQQGGMALDGPYRTRWHVTKRLAYACRDCRKIILDY